MTDRHTEGRPTRSHARPEGEAVGDRVGRRPRQESAPPELTVVVPPESPVLNSLAAAALLRLLHAVHRRRTRAEDADDLGEAHGDRHPGHEERRAA